ncbi:MAG: hypothetical protein II921_09625, partial [Treponema sp.]|nr:hypothetical protein [Treponema sp.]
MKKIFKFLGLAALAAAVLTGCSDLNTASDSGSSSSASSSGAYIKIVDGSAALKTISPNYDTTFTNFTQFKLYCAPTPTDGSTLSWDASNLLKTVSSSSDLTGSTYSVPEGNVTFHLEATHTSQSVYTATTATKIGNGSNTVAFTLCPKTYKIDTGVGSINVTLSFPSKVKAVAAELLTYSAAGTTASYNSGSADKTFIASTNATNKISNNSLTYTAQGVASGIYVLKFTLYADYTTTTSGVTGTGKNKITVYNEVVIVSSQGESKATRTLTDSDLEVPVYTVTYVNIDSSDTTINSAITYDNVYLRGTTGVKVPSVITGTSGLYKTGDNTTYPVYTFAGWYTDSALTTAATVYTTEACTTEAADAAAKAADIYYKTPTAGGNITLYAKWNINITNALEPCASLGYNNFSVGDIILKNSNGTYHQLANKYAQFVTKEELDYWLGLPANDAYSKDSVVFYVPQTTNSDNTITNNSNSGALGTTRVLAVKYENSTGDDTDGTRCQWATISAAGFKKALTSLGVACNSQVTLAGSTVYEYPSGTKYGSWTDSGTTYTALFDGESTQGTALYKLASTDDTAVGESLKTATGQSTIAAALTAATYANFVTALANYPAFKYVMEH